MLSPVRAQGCAHLRLIPIPQADREGAGGVPSDSGSHLATGARGCLGTRSYSDDRLLQDVRPSVPALRLSHDLFHQALPTSGPLPLTKDYTTHPPTVSAHMCKWKHHHDRHMLTLLTKRMTGSPSLGISTQPTLTSEEPIFMFFKFSFCLVTFACLCLHGQPTWDVTVQFFRGTAINLLPINPLVHFTVTC